MLKKLCLFSVLALMAAMPAMAAEADTTAPAAPQAQVDPAFMQQWEKMSPEQRRAFFQQMHQQRGKGGPDGAGQGAGKHHGWGKCNAEGKDKDGNACEGGRRHAMGKGGPGGMGMMDPAAMKERIAKMPPEKRAEMKAKLEQRIKQMQEMVKALDGM